MRTCAGAHLHVSFADVHPDVCIKKWPLLGEGSMGTSRCAHTFPCFLPITHSHLFSPLSLPTAASHSFVLL